MTAVSNQVTSSWLAAVLREAGLLNRGEVLEVQAQEFGAFNSYTQRLKVRYSGDAPLQLATTMILKRNIPEPWAIEAGAEEVKFYQLAAALQPPPPALVPCYASAFDATSGNSYLLLQDLSETHEPPITREQHMSIVNSVPSAITIDCVVDTLASHHAYWWNRPLLQSETFPFGYWSRNAERFALYLQRRQTSWESLRTREANWLPVDFCNLYERVLSHLQHHWERYLEPRFRTQTHLTLVHGDAYFANFLCPKRRDSGATYLLDWQSPVVDIGGYDLANLCATFWTSEQRHEGHRERHILERYYRKLQGDGITSYTWEDLVTDYQSGIIYWLLVPVQDGYDGASRDYWWPKMQCLAAAFRDWQCEKLLGINTA
jgi:hypothetical protein